MNKLPYVAKKMAYLTTAYLPSVQYLSKFLLHEKIYIEKFENYQTQSYRNRAIILGANGLLNLTVPVKRIKNEKILIKNIEIDYKEDWQKSHWRGIENSYKSSPFFEFYKDAFIHFFENKYKFLWDFNFEILRAILNEIEISSNIYFTENFKKSVSGNDYRFIIHPKKKIQKEDAFFSAKPYVQVFSDRFNFIPNLSILDLLFNKGPDTYMYLRSCIATDD